MRIELYQNESDPKTVSKSLTKIGEVEAKLKEDTGMLSPDITLKVDGIDMSRVNYAYIPDFNRYYFLGEPVKMLGGLIGVRGKVDVLMTYKEQLKNVPAVVDKQEGENSSSSYFEDGSFKTVCTEWTDSYNFTGGFLETPGYILITAGGIAAT